MSIENYLDEAIALLTPFLAAIRLNCEFSCLRDSPVCGDDLPPRQADFIMKSSKYEMCYSNASVNNSLKIIMLSATPYC